MANIYGDGGDNTLNGTAAADKLYGYGGSDTLDGGEGNDVLYGGAGSDFLYGGEGNDQLTGGEGDDYMEGGNGNDTYYVDSTGDVVVEGANGGTDTVVSSVFSYQLKANFEVLRLSNDKDGLGNYIAVYGRGNDDNNSIVGNDGDNSLTGLGGNDNINGGGGNDIILGGTGNDIMVGGDGTDLVSYKDITSGGVTVNLSIAGNQNTGNGGIDKLTSFEDLEGTEFADTLTGDAGANKISGLGGGDAIRGGAGDDNLTGGSGSDSFRFEAAGAANGVDFIRAFESGSDTLVFSSAEYDASSTLTTNTTNAQGGTASGAGAQFVYNTATQQLYYDADGAGGADSVLIANFSNNPPVTVELTDIVII